MGAPDLQDVPDFRARLPTEGSRAFGAFLVYRDLGPARSLGSVAKLLCKSLALVSKYSRNHQWKWRVKAYDHHIENLRSEARERAIIAEVSAQAALWERRKQVGLEHYYNSSERLRKVADSMLSVPVTRVVEIEGRSEIEPVGNWRVRDSAALLKAAAETFIAIVKAADRSFEGLSGGLDTLIGVPHDPDEPPAEAEPDPAGVASGAEEVASGEADGAAEVTTGDGLGHGGA